MGLLKYFALVLDIDGKHPRRKMGGLREMETVLCSQDGCVRQSAHKGVDISETGLKKDNSSSLCSYVVADADSVLRKVDIFVVTCTFWRRRSWYIARNRVDSTRVLGAIP